MIITFCYVMLGVTTTSMIVGGIISTIFGEKKDAIEPDLIAPNLVGKNYDEVLENEEYKDFRIIEEDGIYSDTIAAGVITQQEPRSGRTMKTTTIYVTVSLGAKTTKLESVVGMEERAATLQLEKSGFTVRPTYEISEEVTKGYIISMSPDAGTELKAGDVVSLVVSLGPEEVYVRVPNLLGMERDDVQRELERYGLTLGEFIVKTTDDPTKDGQVYDQSIPADTEMLEKTVVDVYVYEYEAPPEPEVTEPDPWAEEPGDGEEQEPIGTYSLTVDLDTTAEVSTVRIEAMGEVRYEANYLSSYGSVQVTLTGTGSEVINIYVNDRFVGNDIAIYE